MDVQAASIVSASKSAEAAMAFALAAERRLSVVTPIMSTKAALPYFMVGMTNSAPSLVPEGQRAVTVLVLV